MIPQETTAVELRISREVGRLHDAAFGGRVRRLRTHVVEDAVLCVLDLPLLASERTLLEGGASREAMCSTRRELEQSLRTGLVAVVEHSSGRTVECFFADASVEPPVTVTVFTLAPATDG